MIFDNFCFFLPSFFSSNTLNNFVKVISTNSCAGIFAYENGKIKIHIQEIIGGLTFYNIVIDRINTQIYMYELIFFFF